eukprot:m.169902 g.169902  ORF g.169902 m.169902 type:complete len:130 (-) comp13161_c0_seq1:219-608(-)
MKKTGGAAEAAVEPSSSKPMEDMTEEDIMRKIMDGELPADFVPPKRRMSEEEMKQKMLDGELDDAQPVEVSKSAWRKQKGEMSKKDSEVAQRILDGELPDEMTGPSAPDGALPDDEAEMMRRIMDGDGP